jgi:hypothetical protein
MAKGYIIEEIRASVRLRDPESGKSIEVPLETGGHWTAPAPASRPRASDASRPKPRTRPPLRRPANARPGASRPPRPRLRIRHPRPSRSRPPQSPTRSAQSGESPAATRASAPRRPAGNKAGRNGERSEKKSDDEASMASPEVRERRVDMQSISPEDAEAWAKLQADLRHMRGRHGGKMGGLGWEETTDAGRSGLIARSGNGAYKILHAGADTYGLFYEWDNGTYERLACGRAEDLMNLANEQARRRALRLPPPTKLSLELARLVCGNARSRRPPPRSASSLSFARSTCTRRAPRPTPLRSRPSQSHPVRRSKEAANDEVATPPAMPVDPAMDAQLVESLKKALAELEGVTRMSDTDTTTSGRLYRVGKHWYVDTALLQSIARRIIGRADAGRLPDPRTGRPRALHVRPAASRCPARPARCSAARARSPSPTSARACASSPAPSGPTRSAANGSSGRPAPSRPRLRRPAAPRAAPPRPRRPHVAAPRAAARRPESHVWLRRVPVGRRVLLLRRRCAHAR